MDVKRTEGNVSTFCFGRQGVTKSLEAIEFLCACLPAGRFLRLCVRLPLVALFGYIESN